MAGSVFRQAEIEYLAGGRQLGRIATVGADGTPHVVPVAWIYNAVRETIDVGGSDLEQTKKFRNVARTGRGRSWSMTSSRRTRGIRAGSRSADAARRSRGRHR